MAQQVTARWAKRKARRLYRRMDTTMEQVLELGEIFEKDHPEHMAVLESIAKTILIAQANLTTFYKLTWGRLPGDWYMDK